MNKPARLKSDIDSPRAQASAVNLNDDGVRQVGESEPPRSKRLRIKPRSWLAMLTIGALVVGVLLLYQHAAYADPQAVSDQLFEAIGRDDAKKVERLLDDGASPNSWGTAGYNILTVAALKGRTAITQLLLLRGADPNIEGPQHIRPLSAAVIGENAETAEVLVKNGAMPATTGPYVGAGAVFHRSGDLFD